MRARVCVSGGDRVSVCVCVCVGGNREDEELVESLQFNESVEMCEMSSSVSLCDNRHKCC